MLAARSLAPRVAVARRSFSSIPIKTCCRVVSMNVGDEATAIKMDALVARMKPILEGCDGFTGVERRVCKAERVSPRPFAPAAATAARRWDYSTTWKFASLDGLKGYLGDEAVQAQVGAGAWRPSRGGPGTRARAQVGELLGEAEAILGGAGAVHRQNFVYDEM